MPRLFHDTYLIFTRSLRITLRNPVWIFFGLFQPLCFLLLFAPLLEKISATPDFGNSNALTVFTPGLLIMIALYSTSFVGFSLIDDIRSGVIERLRVTPMSRTAILLGRVFRDMLILLVQSVFLVTIASLLGLSASWLGIAASFGLVMLVGFSMASLSYCAAFVLQSEDALAPMLNFFLLPLQLLAGITLPLTLAPLWLQKIAAFNPLSHAVSAARALFVGDYTNSAITWGYGAMGFVAVMVALYSSRLFQKSNE